MDTIEQGGLLADGRQLGLGIVERAKRVLDGSGSGDGKKLVDASLIISKPIRGPGFEAGGTGLLAGPGRPCVIRHGTIDIRDRDFLGWGYIQAH